MRVLLSYVFAIIVAATFIPARAEGPMDALPSVNSGESSLTPGRPLDLLGHLRRDRAMTLAQSGSDMVCCHARGTDCAAPTPIAPDSVQWVSRSDCEQFVYGGYPPKTCDPSLCGH
jgi:hypothetical protein